jgi:hypothetical protein
MRGTSGKSISLKSQRALQLWRTYDDSGHINKARENNRSKPQLKRVQVSMNRSSLNCRCYRIQAKLMQIM